MLDIKDFGDNPMFKALAELDEALQENNIKGVELNVIGGFAMMVHGYRGADGMTDIDFVGPDLAKKVGEIADDIGMKYNLGRKWINNDVLLSGSSLEDMEFATGKLHFMEAFELESIKINILESKDLLKMKVVAIDTSLSAVELGDGDFTRYKDFDDILKLKGALKMSNIAIKEMMGDMLLSGHTISAIKAYEMGGMERVDKVIEKAREDNNIFKAESVKQSSLGKEASYSRSGYLDSILDSAIKRSREYNDRSSPSDRHEKNAKDER